MTDTFTLPQNPYVSIQNEIIGITSGRKSYKFPLQRIEKMHVSKRKSEQFSDILGSFLNLTPEFSYTLFIKTQDGKETKIKISSFERYYFIRLISLVRHLHKGNTNVLA